MTTEELKTALDGAKTEACLISYDEECVQHVNMTQWRGEVTGFVVSDWADSATVASFENGREIG